MEKPRNCTPHYNLKRLGEPHEKLRLLCLYAENRELIANLIHEAGGYQSSGICKNHTAYAIWHAKQPLTAEEIQKQKEFEAKKERCREQAKRLKSSR